MKARDALIAWTPKNDSRATAGQVKVGPLVHGPDWTKPFSMTGGAAYTVVREMEGPLAVARVFIDFNTIVVRDGVDPLVAHQAFLAIDEYAEMISPDIPGAKDKEE